jgi:minor tail protein
MAISERRTLAIEAKLRDLLSAPLTKMEKNLTRFGVIASRSLTAAGIAIGAIVAGSVVGFRALLHIAEGLDQVAKSSDNLGITAESLTAIRNGAELAGVTIDQLGVAMKSFAKVVDEANRGGAKQRETLERLGLSAKDFRGDQLNVVDVLAQVADGLSGVDSSVARTKILVDLFGKSGQQLGALLKLGSAGIREMAAEAQKLGIVFSREELQRVEDFKDSYAAVGQTLRGLAERLIVDIAPAFTKFFDDLRRNLTSDSDAVREAMLVISESVVEGVQAVNRGLQLAQLTAQGFGALIDILTVPIDPAKRRPLGDELQERADSIRTINATADAASKSLEKLRASIRKMRADAGNLPPIKAGEVEAAPSRWDEFWGGFSDGAKNAIEEWRDFDKAGQQAAKGIIDGGLNELVNVLSEVGRSINSVSEFAEKFTRAFVADLQKIISKLLVMEAIQLVGLGAEEGGVVPLARGGIKRYAGGGLNRRGGIATRPTVLFGEGSNAEAFVPLPDNRSIPVSFVGGGPSGGTSINLYITAMDSKDVQRVLVEEQTTLRAIFENHVQTKVGMRRTIQRVR